MNAPVNTPEVPRHRVLAQVVGTMKPGYENILTPDALLFLADLERRFGRTRRNLLEDRQDRQDRFDYGEMPAGLECGKSPKFQRRCVTVVSKSQARLIVK